MNNSSKLLIDEPALQVLPSLAELLGLSEAIVLQQIHYFIHLNEASNRKKNKKEGRWWTYNSYGEWQKNVFPFWSEATVKRIFQSLEKQGVLIGRQLAEDKHDRTKWYTIDYDALNEKINEPVFHPIVVPEPEKPDRSDENTPSTGSNCPDGNDRAEEVPSDQNDPLLKPENPEALAEEESGASAAKPARRPASNNFNEVPLEIQLFHNVTGRYPRKDQLPQVVTRLRSKAYTAKELRPFWDAWVARDYKPTNLGWLDWVESGSIPEPWKNKPSGSRRSSEPKGFDAIRKMMEEHKNGDI
jgi:hypothetical protein